MNMVLILASKLIRLLHSTRCRDVQECKFLFPFLYRHANRELKIYSLLLLTCKTLSNPITDLDRP